MVSQPPAWLGQQEPSCRLPAEPLLKLPMVLEESQSSFKNSLSLGPPLPPKSCLSHIPIPPDTPKPSHSSAKQNWCEFLNVPHVPSFQVFTCAVPFAGTFPPTHTPSAWLTPTHPLGLHWNAISSRKHFRSPLALVPAPLGSHASWAACSIMMASSPPPNNGLYEGSDLLWLPCRFKYNLAWCLAHK